MMFSLAIRGRLWEVVEEQHSIYESQVVLFWKKGEEYAICEKYNDKQTSDVVLLLLLAAATTSSVLSSFKSSFSLLNIDHT